MKKHSKLSLCIILSLAMIVSMIPMGTAFAAEEDVLLISAQSETTGAKTVCTVSVYGEETGCATLKEAVAAAGEWGSITLTDDLETETIAITGSRYLSIEFAGHKVKGTSKNGVVFDVSGEAELNIQGWEGGGEINGSVVITEGKPTVSINAVDLVNDIFAPVYVKAGTLGSSRFQVMNGKISTKSAAEPAVKIEGNTECSLWDLEITSEGTGIAAYAGKVNLSSTNVTAKKTAVAIGRTLKGYPVSIDLGGGTIKGETALLEKNEQGYTGSDKIKVVTNFSTIDGKISSDNLGAFIQEAFFVDMPDEAYIDPAYEIVVEEMDSAAYAVYKRGEAAGLRSVLLNDYYEDGTYFDDYYYYKTFEGVDFASRMEQIRSDAQNFGYARVEVVADNDVAVTAVIDDKISLKVNTFAANNITATDGCTLHEESAGATTVYTAEATPVSFANIFVNYVEKKVESSDYLKLSVDGALTGVSAAENNKIVEALKAQKDEILAGLDLNQSKLGSALSEAGIGFNKAADIKLYILAHLEADINSKESVSEKISAFGITATPVYEVYASTAASAAAIVTADEAADSTRINAVALAEPETFALTNKDGSNMDITLRLPVPKELGLKATDKVILKYYPDGSMTTGHFTMQECKLSETGSNVYLTFSTKDGLGELKFGINGKVCYMSINNGAPRYYEYLTNVLSGESEGQTVFLTKDAKDLTDDEKGRYLMGILYQAASDVKIDKSAAPDVEFTILPYTGYAYYKSTEGNVDTYNVVNVADLKFKAASKLTQKGVKVTVTPKSASKEAFDQLKAQGYKFEYKFYRSEKKASKYAAKFTSKGNTYTNTSGKKGKKYYYKAKVTITDPEGNVCATTAIKNCSYACRTWKK